MNDRKPRGPQSADPRSINSLPPDAPLMPGDSRYGNPGTEFTRLPGCPCGHCQPESRPIREADLPLITEEMIRAAEIKTFPAREPEGVNKGMTGSWGEASVPASGGFLGQRYVALSYAELVTAVEICRLAELALPLAEAYSPQNRILTPPAGVIRRLMNKLEAAQRTPSAG